MTPLGRRLSSSSLRRNGAARPWRSPLIGLHARGLSRLDEDEMRDLMREIVNKIYTFLVKAEDPDFQAFRDYVRPATYEWDKPRLDSVLMHHVEEYARNRQKKR